MLCVTISPPLARAPGGRVVTTRASTAAILPVCARDEDASAPRADRPAQGPGGALRDRPPWPDGGRAARHMGSVPHRPGGSRLPRGDGDERRELVPRPARG